MLKGLLLITNSPDCLGSNIHTQSVPNELVQDNIRPEKKNAWEVGADIRFFNDRFGVDFAFYKENTKNQIMPIEKAEVSGITSYLINAENIQNKGIEVELKTIPFRNKDWEWNVNLTYTRNRNKIIELHESAGEYIRLAGYVNAFNFRIGSVANVGGAYGTLFSDAMPAVDKETGQNILIYHEAFRAGYYQRANEVQNLGVSINPDFLGSISTGLKWKNLSFNALLDMRYGGYIASYSNHYLMAYGLHQNSLFGRDAASGGITFTSIYDGLTYDDGIIPNGIFRAGETVTPPGHTESVKLDGLTYQEAINKGYIDPARTSTYNWFTSGWGNGTVNDNWFHKVKYIAVREISIGYAVPKVVTSNLGLASLRVGLNARNLGYLYNSLPNNLNAESIRGSAAGEFCERGFVPNRASYTLNIGVDF